MGKTMTEDTHEGGYSGKNVGQALSKTIHIGIPIASIVVVLAFAFVVFQPADKSTLPAESTLWFIPIYLTIVCVLVFGSMYLFKRVMDTEEETAPATEAHSSHA
jgi:flagellar biosynthesis protein FliQ